MKEEQTSQLPTPKGSGLPQNLLCEKLGGINNALIQDTLAMKFAKESDDLEKASDDYAHSTLVGSPSVKKNAFKAGARWQQEKDKKWLADNHKQIFNNGWEEGFEDGRDDAYDEIISES